MYIFHGIGLEDWKSISYYQITVNNIWLKSKIQLKKREKKNHNHVISYKALAIHSPIQN